MSVVLYLQHFSHTITSLSVILLGGKSNVLVIMHVDIDTLEVGRGKGSIYVLRKESK